MIVINKKISGTRVAFTPAFYKTAYKNYEKGSYREIIAMMKRAAVDSHVAGCLMGRKAGFQREYSIAPFSEENQDRERAEWFAQMFSNLNMRKLFKRIHEAVLYRFSVIDFDWEIIDNRDSITGFKWFDQKYFKYDPKETDQLKIDLGNTLQEIPPETLICESEDNPVMLPVLRDYILKEFGLEAWSGFLETFGDGIIIGRYPAGADDDVKNDLDTAINAIAQSSRGRLPDNVDIELKELSRTTGDHQKYVDVADTGISIAILGHENAVKQSQGLQVGENQTSHKAKREISIDDMYFIDEQVQEIVKTINDRNFSDRRYPKFIINKAEPIDVSKHADVVDMAYRHGVKINPSEYSKLGMQIYEDQEPVQRESLFED